MTASVAERTALAADLVKLVIRTDWEQPHQAGQYLQLSLPGYEGAHYFSIASAPSNFPEVTLLVRIGSSALDQAMAGLRPDDAVNLSSPNGRFLKPRPPAIRCSLSAGAQGSRRCSPWS